MAKKTPQKRDGCYKRADRKGWWITWTDAGGRRRQRKTDAQNITQAKVARANELVRVEQAKILGPAPPAKDTFGEVSERFLKYQSPGFRRRPTPGRKELSETIWRNSLPYSWP